MAKLGRGTGAIVTAQMDADYAAGLIGNGKYILPIGEKLRCEIIDNNTVRIYDGVAVSQGRYIYLETNTYNDFAIENGKQSVNRTDVIGYKIKQTSTEDVCEEFVMKNVTNINGIAEGELREGDRELLIPLYGVNIEGITIKSVTQLCANLDSIEKIISTATKDYNRISNNCKILEERIANQIIKYDNMLSDAGTEFTEIKNQNTVINRRTGEVNIYARIAVTKDIPAGKSFKVATVSAAIGKIPFALPVTFSTAITTISQAKAGFFPFGSEYPLEIRATSLTTMKTGSYAYLHLNYFPNEIMLNLQEKFTNWVR